MLDRLIGSRDEGHLRIRELLEPDNPAIALFEALILFGGQQHQAVPPSQVIVTGSVDALSVRDPKFF
jgi:hypothetical protein